MTRQPKMHVHRHRYLPPEEPEAEGYGSWVVKAIVIVFVLVYVLPSVLGWHG